MTKNWFMRIFKFNMKDPGIVRRADCVRNGFRLFENHIHYLTVEIGIPGAIQHLAGAKFSGAIAVNETGVHCNKKSLVLKKLVILLRSFTGFRN